MRISVIVPTYRRGDALTRCIDALTRQSRRADEIIVTARPEDDQVVERVRACDDPRLRVVNVAAPGVIAAMNAGLATACGDLIALTDDDAAPWPDWLTRIESCFRANPRLGALGGKDWQYKGDPLKLDDGSEPRGGELQWWGRVIGDHHHATPGPAREVAVVKGVNCAFRAEALRQIGGFDTRLLGTGAQVHWELSACLALKRAGWKVVFDPSLGVDHFCAIRFDEDQRCKFNGLAQRNMVHNETLVLGEHFHGVQRVAFLAWASLIGTRGSPGLAQVPRLMLKRRPNVGRLWWATVRGRLMGLKALRRPAVNSPAGSTPPLDSVGPQQSAVGQPSSRT